MPRCLVAGAGGFIGGHLTARLLSEGYEVRAVDIKPRDEWWQWHNEVEKYHGFDLRDPAVCRSMCEDVDYVYQLACLMGGIGMIESRVYDCSLNALINIQMLKAAEACGVKKFFYSSSACVYNASKQARPGLPALKESDAYPAMAEPGYGWSKLYSELICQYAAEENRVETRIARFHNSYGPHGSWNDGTEKAPAANCRKVAMAKLGYTEPEITIWGDGTRTRSFMFIEDNIDGIELLMNSDYVRGPLNMGSSECVTINELVNAVEEVADFKVRRKYDMSKAQGVYGRNSDNTLIKDQLNWEPTTSLREGLSKTYPWIEDQVREQNG